MAMSNLLRHGQGKPNASQIKDFQLGYDKYNDDLYLNASGKIVYIGGNTISGEISGKVDLSIFKSDTKPFSSVIIHHLEPRKDGNTLYIDYLQDSIGQDNTATPRNGSIPINSPNGSISYDWLPEVPVDPAYPDGEKLGLTIGVSDYFSGNIEERISGVVYTINERIDNIKTEGLSVIEWSALDANGGFSGIANPKLGDKIVLKNDHAHPGTVADSYETWLYQYVEYLDLANNGAVLYEWWTAEYKIEGDVIYPVGDEEWIHTALSGAAHKVTLTDAAIAKINLAITDISFLAPSGLILTRTNGNQETVSFEQLVIDEGSWN